MVVKLKLQLKANEVIALSKLLAIELKRCELKDLQANPADFLIMSAVYELYAKSKDKSENIRLFGSKRSNELHGVSISRTQALALACISPQEPDPASELQTYEANFLQGLLARIHQTFLI